VTPRRDSAQTLLALMWAGGAVVLAFEATVQHQAGEKVSPFAWVVVGILALLSLATYEWDVVWRVLRPPLTFEPATLPPAFDWGEVSRRMSTYQDADGAEDSPDELDSVYGAIHDAVTLEYVDVVREMLKGYDGSVSWHPIDPELGTDQSGRACFVGSKDVWRLDPPVVLPSPHRNELILVDRIDAEATLRADGPWRWTVMHGRLIDRGTGAVEDRRQEFFTAPGVGEVFGPRQVLGA